MRPKSGSEIRRPDLGAVVYEVAQEAPTMGFIGDRVMPVFPVSKYTGTYPVIPKEALFNLYDVERGRDGNYNIYDGDFERGHFETRDRGLTKRKDERDMAIYGDEFDYEQVISRILMNNIMRAKEYRIANKVMNPANFTPVDAETAWATTETAVPQKDIEKGKDALRSRGVPANCLILPYAKLAQLRTNKDVKNSVYQLFPDTVKTGVISVEHLRTYFDIQYLLVAGALYNTAAGGQNAILGDLWGEQYAMLCRVAEPGSDITEPCIGRTFLWNEGSNQEEYIVEEYYDDDTRSWKLRVRHDSVEQLLSSFDEDGNLMSEISKSAGYLIDTAPTG